MRPFLGCLADDVTGATDLASNLVQAGVRTIQWLGLADDGQSAETAEAVVLALKTRSMPAAEAVRQSLAGLQRLQALGCQRFYFKYCSTFDSTAQGNIGPVAEALLDALQLPQTIFCPAFPENGRTVYQGHLFVHARLLHESGMECHPLNPMRDANVVRLLQAQSTAAVGLLPAPIIDRGVTASQQALRQMQDEGRRLVVVDALHAEHLQTLGAACASMPFVTGGSGLATGLAAAYRSLGLLPPGQVAAPAPTVTGRTAILCGSCSQATQQQVAWMKPHCPSHQLDLQQCVQQAESVVRQTVQWSQSVDARQPVLIYSTTSAEQVAAAQASWGRERVAAAMEDVLARIAQALVEQCNVRRLVIAGGETAGAIVARLGVTTLQIGPRIVAGVPWTESLNGPPLALALKSGNFGEADFFQKAIEMLP